jgi:hypothetical protein
VRTAAKDLLAAKSGLPEATKQLADLRDILKDPGLVAAADSFTSALIKGFAKAASGIAITVKEMRSAAVQLGLATPTTRKDFIDSTKSEISTKERDLTRLRSTALAAGIDENTSPEIAAARKEIDQLNAALRRLQLIIPDRGPSTRGSGRGLGPMGTAPNIPLPRKGGGGGSSSSIIQAGGGARDFNSMIPIDPQSLERSGRMWTDQFGDIEQVIKDIEKSMEDVSKTWGETTDEMSLYADQAARNMQGALADFLFDPFEDGLKGMARGFVDTLRRMVAEAAAASIFDSFKGAAGGTLGSILGSVFGGARASGGPVSAGKAYLVGERGPELFAPGASGSIIPNGKMGGGIVINQSIDARGATADLVQALPAILAENNRRMYDELDRRWGLR